MVNKDFHIFAVVCASEYGVVYARILPKQETKLSITVQRQTQKCSPSPVSRVAPQLHDLSYANRKVVVRR